MSRGCAFASGAELGEDLPDGADSGPVGRQEDEVGAPGPDGGSCGLDLVAAQIVQDDDVARREGWGQDLLDIEHEEFAVDGTVDHPWRVDAVVAQGGDEGLGLPVAEGGVGLQAFAPHPPAAQGRHVGLHPGFVDEHQARDGDPALVGLPPLTLAAPRAGARLLLRQQGFF